MLRDSLQLWRLPRSIALSVRQAHYTISYRHAIAPGSFVRSLSTKDEQRYAIIGAGFAGLAAAWNILNYNGHSGPVHVTVFDMGGIGAGGSGAAAGLLHPYTPRGKLLWKGEQAMEAAMRLLKVAEAAAGELSEQSKDGQNALAWRTGMIRPSTNLKQSMDFMAAASALPDTVGTDALQLTEGHENASVIAQDLPAASFSDCSAGPAEHEPAQRGAAACSSRSWLRMCCLTKAQAERLLPGVQIPALRATAIDAEQQLQQQQVKGRRKGWGARKNAAVSVDDAAALQIPGGITLQPHRYMQMLWRACQLAASQRKNSSADLVYETVTSLAKLQRVHGPFKAVVVAAGAAVGCIEEIGDTLPLDLCQGYTLEMEASISSEGGSTDVGYPPQGPSILGSTYLSSQGAKKLIVGATQKHGISAQAAKQECTSSLNRQGQAEAEAAAVQLLANATTVWPNIAAWEITTIRSGVRALPPRTQLGSIPLLGRLQVDPACGKCWLLVGLGARGLVYHAWLAEVLVAAMMADDEGHIPSEMVAWKHELKQ